MLQKIDHIGLAVKSLEEGVAFCEKVLGLPCEGREEVPAQKVRVAFFRVGEARLELLEPLSPDSPVAKFLEKNGEGLHHLAFRTNDLAAQMAQAVAAGGRLINDQPLEGAHGKLVAFLHPKSAHGALLEICSDAKE